MNGTVTYTQTLTQPGEITTETAPASPTTVFATSYTTKYATKYESQSCEAVTTTINTCDTPAGPIPYQPSPTTTCTTDSTVGGPAGKTSTPVAPPTSEETPEKPEPSTLAAPATSTEDVPESYETLENQPPAYATSTQAAPPAYETAPVASATGEPAGYDDEEKKTGK
ncbi:hypothetical protein MBLNU230_g8081t1 [Neophaeotheca triangularis]